MGLQVFHWLANNRFTTKFGRFSFNLWPIAPVISLSLATYLLLLHEKSRVWKWKILEKSLKNLILLIHLL